MGGLVTKIFKNTLCPSFLRFMGVTLKRKYSDTSEYQPPQKRRLLSPSRNINKKQLKRMKSDITILGMGKAWHVHKIALCQTPYFNCMFNGMWKESEQRVIEIQFPDENITNEALDSFFDCLYLDKIDINEGNVLATLATASMFQMDDIIVKCAEVMRESLSWQNQNMITYFEASKRYGVTPISRAVVAWLELNYFQIYNQEILSLKKITPNLMTALVTSHVFAHFAGKELYPLIRTWLYFMVFPAYNPSDSVKPSVSAGHFFLTRTDKQAFLQTEMGCKFSDPFKAAVELKRFESSDDIKTDNIIPGEWFLRSY
ncbi:GMCL1.2 family protein [Megaselia abdita]